MIKQVNVPEASPQGWEGKEWKGMLDPSRYFSKIIEICINERSKQALICRAYWTFFNPHFLELLLCLLKIYQFCVIFVSKNKTCRSWRFQTNFLLSNNQTAWLKYWIYDDKDSLKVLNVIKNWINFQVLYI